MSTGHNTLNFCLGDSYASPRAVAGAAHHHPGLGWVAPLTEVNEMTSVSHEALLVGAADQYRLGDLLMPHVLTRLINFSRLRCAGLVTADLTPVGGHSVRNYGECLLEMRGSHLKLVHFGAIDISVGLVEGYQGAADGDEAERFESLAMISSHDDLKNYVRRRTGQLGDFAYMLAPEGEFYGAGLSFHAIGLPEPGRLDEVAKSSLLATLRQAQFVGVRDEIGANFLEAEGIVIERMPCGLSVLPQVCARQLREARDSESLESIRHRFPNGWIAVEVSEVRGGDFDRLTTALREISDRDGLGLVFFEGTKALGDRRPASLRRWVEAFPEWQAAEFGSDNIWEVASFLLHSRLYCGSCLSSRVICMSGGVARINVPTGAPAAGSYCELWEHDSVPIEFADDEDWAVALDEALSANLSVLQQHAAWLHRRYQESLERFCRETGMSARLVAGPVETPHARTAALSHHLHDEWLSNASTTRLFKRLNRRLLTRPFSRKKEASAARMQ